MSPTPSPFLGSLFPLCKKISIISSPHKISSTQPTNVSSVSNPFLSRPPLTSSVVPVKTTVIINPVSNNGSISIPNVLYVEKIFLFEVTPFNISSLCFAFHCIPKKKKKYRWKENNAYDYFYFFDYQL